jgi:myosin-5
MGVRKLELIREERAAVKIQAAWRGYIQRQRYLKQRQFVVRLQASCKAKLTRKKFSNIREHFAAIKIQSLVRGFLIRKEYIQKKRCATLIQTAVRRLLAKKLLVTLKQEARSANHFKEVSYKLESKVVELTQNATQHRDERDQFKKRAYELENEVKSWVDKYEKLDVKAKELEKTLEAPSHLELQLESVTTERNNLQNDYRNSMDRIKKQDQEISRLNQDLVRQKEEIAHLKDNMPRAGMVVDEAEVAELKNQILALKAQLSQSLKNHPKRQGSLNAYRALSPQRNDHRGMSPDYNRGRSPSADPRGRSPSSLTNGSMRRTSLTDRIQTEVVYAEPEQMKPKRYTQRSSLDPEKIGNPEEAITKLLQESEPLEEEVIEGLIHTLKVVPPDMQNIPSKEEVFFPVHIIGMCVTQMWRLGYLMESEHLLLRAMDTIQSNCSVSHIDASHCCFPNFFI